MSSLNIYLFWVGEDWPVFNDEGGMGRKPFWAGGRARSRCSPGIAIAVAVVIFPRVSVPFLFFLLCSTCPPWGFRDLGG